MRVLLLHMQVRVWARVCAAVFCATLPMGVVTAETLTLGDAREYKLAPFMEILEDPGGKLTVDQTRDAKFKKIGDRSPGPGFSNSAFWLRFSVKNSGQRARDFILELSWPHLDRVEFFVRGEAPRAKPAPMGREYPFANRLIPHRYFLLPLKISPGENAQVLMRVESREVISLPLRLITPELRAADDREAHLVLGIFYGIMLAMILYNLFIYFSLRETTYLVYVLFLVSMTAYQLVHNGLFPLLLPDLATGNTWALWVSIQVTRLLAAWFLILFLELRRRSRPLLYVFYGIIAWDLLMSGLRVFDHPTISYIYHINSMFVFIAVLGVIVYETVRGYTPARFLLIAWLALIAGYVVISLRFNEILPAGFFNDNAGQIGAAMEAILISLALADRINIMKARLQTFNTELERNVAERTSELREALDDLNQKNNKIHKELELGHEVQQTILPAPEFIGERVHAAAYCRYLEPVGGDYFDYFNLKEAGSGILLADASGHGIPAALITAMAKISFIESTRPGDVRPDQILLDVNTRIAQLLRSHVYLTAVLVVFQPDGTLTYSNAGHVSPLLHRRGAGELVTLEEHGVMLGTFSTESMPVPLPYTQVSVEPGDRLLVYTDGMSDAWSPGTEEIGTEAIEELFRASADYPLEAARDFIRDGWLETVGPDGFRDDSSFILMEVR